MIIWFVKNEKWEKFSSRSKIQNYFQEKRKIFEFKCYEIFIHVVVKAVVGWLGGHIKRSVICCLLSEAVNQWRSKASASSSNCFPPKLQTLFCCMSACTVVPSIWVGALSRVTWRMWRLFYERKEDKKLLWSFFWDFYFAFKECLKIRSCYGAPEYSWTPIHSFYFYFHLL